MTTAFCGFGMGATPNAMANMRALVERYGAAPRAFFIVPLVGSLFVDFFNSMVLTTFHEFSCKHVFQEIFDKTFMPLQNKIPPFP
ncbi:MAG: sodium/glutamate symporter [Pilosibacter sp.]